ncbi:hypothetical protein PIB30_019207 [Stylosanthes scabra]|uniref:Uncharacterized protein n=1 Tax=Stylosanthes scabra TaxID=79078 RepID=A0ABU6Q7Z7_9FABA|nr:hypothetical protein [Stylosanthes scabra]
MPFFYYIFVFPVAYMMWTNMWVCFVGIGFNFLPFILCLYLDATPDQVVVEEASPQSNTEDHQSQVTPEVASPPPAIEVEVASPQFSSESQLPEVTKIIPLPQLGEGGDSSQAIINEASSQDFSEDDESHVVTEVASPQGSNEDHR